MDQGVAKALEGLVGPLVAQGLKLGVAENIAKVRAFDAGAYRGEHCIRCGRLQGLLWPPAQLCHECHFVSVRTPERLELAAQAHD